MEKFQKLDYLEVPSNSNTSDFENKFIIQPLERGFGTTLGVALRRVLLSNITSLAPFCVRIEGVTHEFRGIEGVVEDVPSLIMNLRKVRFSYDPELVKDDDIIRVELKADQVGEINSRYLEVVDNLNVEVIDHNVHIAEVSQENALRLELYLRPGRGFVSSEENKALVSKLEAQLETKIKKGKFIAVDSNFSPVEKVNYVVSELNSSSIKIEEKLEFNVYTDGTVKPKDAIKQAADILIAHFKEIGNVDEIRNDIFETADDKITDNQETDIDITQLGLSVRSLNALRRIGRTKVSDISKMSYEELEQTKNLGKKSLDEIVQKIKEHGFELRKGDE
ncbi:DNA-directed RNA polymerase subunit alpha [Mycoplasmopsis alligatoris]|uniref:DNA-directed RNA polymerase subunit alpha n=1 Tax=Mycoplasmopsis alligatoris A21JP2 TaxID=747682 RepID=D4XWU9_9BACT|nr:DNA-directed RNA polymerase subunit alpha [Mycoplasmopsis alligatoris]EFF41217.1 DNA-directed RNA polymerase, alpha subunit [Mycoplasmopsis alligatoris A21JP2]